MRWSSEYARERFLAARVARLATVTTAGRPHLVPVVFAGDADTVVIAIDAKPKRTTEVKRVANIEANPSVSLLVDHYSEDWSRLWWVRADGDAGVVRSGESRESALGRLARKYPPYRETPPTGPVIVVEVVAWSGWSAG